MAPPPPPPYATLDWSPSYSPSPRSPNSRYLFGAASVVLPPSPLSSPSSPEVWWPLPNLPSPISTLDAPITPSPVYSSTTPSPLSSSSWPPYSPVTPPIYYPTSSSHDAAGLISPGFHPCCSLPSCNCPLPTAHPPNSPNFCPEEFNHGDHHHAYPASGPPLPYYNPTSQIHGNSSMAYSASTVPTTTAEFNHGDHHAYPAPAPPLPYYNPTSQIHGNSSSMAYSSTAPGPGTAGSSGWNRSSPAWWEPPVLQLPPTPILSPWSDPYSPVTPRYSPVPVQVRNDREGTSLAHGGVATAPAAVYFCYCCLSPVEDCCCNGDASLAHGGDTSAPEYCYCCSTRVEDCCCMAGDDAPALPPLLPPPA
ncbi:unnamed protein product [Urochloa decumbens]|uniref:Uncharacterized protein n=1 Tax=Urochloa decumbens TaxID=240449 RepID=A0ABC9FEZ8_9POAL